MSPSSAPPPAYLAIRLAKLTLAGFKSFARTTTLEFPAPVSAIVGPNGSGKSNIAEAIRWVLGEQSLKTLRGKRGEDLIFNGSPQAPRMGKAAVRLTFDNRDRAIPVEFPEVRLERKIFRDGTNEYALNGSPVRLRDIVELLARMGLGEAKHNIIGQGEVDRALLASPRERRELLEEAMGLRIWQLKLREAARKLEATAGNELQVQALLKELAPHLKFLKTQADRAEKREAVRRELEGYYRAYITAEQADITRDAEALDGKERPAARKLATLESEIFALNRELEGAGGGGTAAGLGEREAKQEGLEAKRRELERTLGRVEGRLEGGRGDTTRRPVAASRVAGVLRPLLAALRQAGEERGLTAGELRARIAGVATELERFLNELENTAAGGQDPGGLEAERERIQAELADLGSQLAELRRELGEEFREAERMKSTLRERFGRLREREEEAGRLRADLQRLAFEREKLALRERELGGMAAESGLGREAGRGADQGLIALGREELRPKIERLRARLEEIGGIDPAVEKEYGDTKARSEFLTRELADLVRAGRDLRHLIAELEARIEQDFHKGFAKIKEAFGHYFRVIFGGGKAALTLTALSRPADEATGEAAGGDEDAEGEEQEYGVDIQVDLPHKRIKGLAMLSGGERSLVAIALLFAVTSVNPPPFLVLDETDAALDEANSRRYAVILEELSAKTQLILITHNRETMHCAGILYGATMGEDGISKLLSLKLEEAESYGNR